MTMKWSFSYNSFVKLSLYNTVHWPVFIVQSVASLTADPGVMSLIPALSHTFVEIDHEIFSMAILLLPLIQEGLSVTSESMCMKYLLTA